MAFAVVVTTSPTVPEAAAAPEAEVAVVSRPEAPEYRATAPPLGTDEVVQA
jgi:hypothetical protein